MPGRIQNRYLPDLLVTPRLVVTVVFFLWPAGTTSILVYMVFETGFIGQDYGSWAAQSVVLMTLVIAMTASQFGYDEKRVSYS